MFQRSWVSTHHQTFSRLLESVHYFKKALQLVRRGQQPSSQECPGQCSTSYAGRWEPRVSPRWCTHVDSTRPLQSQTWPFGEESTQKRWFPPVLLVSQTPHSNNNGCYPSSPCSKPHNSNLSSSCTPPPDQVSVCKQVSLCAGSIRCHMGFELPSVLPGCTESSLIFTARCHENSSSRHRTLTLGTPPSSGGISATKGSLPVFDQYLGFVVSPFCISLPPTHLKMASSLYP